MYYGYVGGGIKTVVRDFEKIRELQLKHPYSSFRKFYYEDKAWAWVKRRASIKDVKNIIRYGDTFHECYATMEYFITDDAVYYNFRTPKLGKIFLTSSDKNVSIENRLDLIMVKLSNAKLGDTILGHLSAIYAGIRILGEFIDVEIVAKDHSIFYALTRYTGNDNRIRRVAEYLDQRVAKFSVTLYDF